MLDFINWFSRESKCNIIISTDCIEMVFCSWLLFIGKQSDEKFLFLSYQLDVSTFNVRVVGQYF